LQIFFKKIAESAKRENKFAWAESQDKDKQIKGNIAGVIGSQFKPLKDKDKLMPQSTSMNMANTIDALCDAQASQEEIQKFLDCWKKSRIATKGLGCRKHSRFCQQHTKLTQKIRAIHSRSG